MGKLLGLLPMTSINLILRPSMQKLNRTKLIAVRFNNIIFKKWIIHRIEVHKGCKSIPTD